MLKWFSRIDTVIKSVLGEVRGRHSKTAFRSWWKRYGTWLAAALSEWLWLIVGSVGIPSIKNFSGIIDDLLKAVVQRTRLTNEKQNANYRHSTLHSLFMRKAGWPCCNAQNVLYKWRSPLLALQSQTCWIFLAKKIECGGFRREPANWMAEAFLSSWMESRVSETLPECSWSDLKVGPQKASVSRDLNI